MFCNQNQEAYFLLKYLYTIKISYNVNISLNQLRILSTPKEQLIKLSSFSI